MQNLQKHKNLFHYLFQINLEIYLPVLIKFKEQMKLMMMGNNMVYQKEMMSMMKTTQNSMKSNNSNKSKVVNNKMTNQLKMMMINMQIF